MSERASPFPDVNKAGVPRAECPLCRRLSWTDVCLGLVAHRKMEDVLRRILEPLGFGKGDGLVEWILYDELDGLWECER